jgi:hypothetical protein
MRARPLCEAIELVGGVSRAYGGQAVITRNRLKTKRAGGEPDKRSVGYDSRGRRLGATLSLAQNVSPEAQSVSDGMTV